MRKSMVILRVSTMDTILDTSQFFNAKKFILANLEEPITQQDRCTNSLHISDGWMLLFGMR